MSDSISDPHDNPHPLDEALRRQLSDYREAPSPQVWAGVRARLAGSPAPRPVPLPPWRRRPVRQLGVLLSLLIGIWLLLGPLQATLIQPRPAAETAGAAKPTRNNLPVTSQPSTSRRDGLNNSNTSAREAAVAASVAALPPTGRQTPSQSAPSAVAQAGGLTSANPAAAATPGPARNGTGTGGAPPRVTRHSEVAEASKMPEMPAASSSPSARLAAAATLAKRPAASPPDRAPTPKPQLNAALTNRLPTRTHHAATTPESAAAQVARTGARKRAASETGPAERPAVSFDAAHKGSINGSKSISDSSAGSEAEELLAPTSANSTAALALTNLALTKAQISLALQPIQSRASTAPAAGQLNLPPAPLALLPDSLTPTPLAGKRRRWAVQAGAGPALSYRTLRQPEQSGPAQVAQRERPGLGWGAQVQVRRVLSGRWALAVGVGFQQYATRPGQPEQAGRTPTNSLAGSPAALTRDTYNLLVAPVQLSYGLGNFGPRWQVAAVGGLEPGRYLGGRTTVVGSSAALDFNNLPGPATTPIPPGTSFAGANYNFGQRTYASAEASPYRPWNLGLSLGLEVRYRLTPASRWQLLMQPAVRGVVSPFARAATVDYSRQPFSLGGLAGLSWDVR